MRAVIQRVEEARVTVEGRAVGEISKGLLVLLAIEASDGLRDLAFLKKKILNLRVFEDELGKMNLSLLDAGASVLMVSQFTLYGDSRKGNRPSYSRAAPPTQAKKLYHELIEQLRLEGVTVEAGKFQAMMKVALINDGPVTLIVDSNKQYY